MAFAALDSTSEPRSMSLGPLKMQILSYSAVSGDTTGTITADNLTSVSHVIIDGGLTRTAADSISGNVVTLAFVAAPAGGLAGTVICLGR